MQLALIAKSSYKHCGRMATAGITDTCAGVQRLTVTIYSVPHCAGIQRVTVTIQWATSRTGHAVQRLHTLAAILPVSRAPYSARASRLNATQSHVAKVCTGTSSQTRLRGSMAYSAPSAQRNLRFLGASFVCSTASKESRFYKLSMSSNPFGLSCIAGITG
jgi:hypothetical protein